MSGRSCRNLAKKLGKAKPFGWLTSLYETVIEIEGNWKWWRMLLEKTIWLMIWANTSSQGSRKWTSAFLVSQWNDGKLLPQCRLHTLILHSYSQILMKRTRYIFPLLFIPCASHFIDETHGQVLVNSNRFVLFGFYKKFNRFKTFSILCLSLLVQPVLFMIWTCAYFIKLQCW